MQKVKGRPDEPVEKDPLDDEDDVVDAIAPNKYYYRPIPGDLDESVTGIGGRDVSGDDPSLGGEYQGHPGLDEEEDDVEEEDLVEFFSDHGVRYAGRVIAKNSRHVIVEMHDKRRVKTRIGNPSLKKL